jgi:hypothetical protein
MKRLYLKPGSGFNAAEFMGRKGRSTRVVSDFCGAAVVNVCEAIQLQYGLVRIDGA